MTQEITIAYPLHDKIKYLFHFLAQGGFKDFLKIELVENNSLYARFSRWPITHQITHLNCCMSVEDFEKVDWETATLKPEEFERIELSNYHEIPIEQLVDQLNEARLFLINLEKPFSISKNKICNLNCRFIT